MGLTSIGCVGLSVARLRVFGSVENHWLRVRDWSHTILTELVGMGLTTIGWIGRLGRNGLVGIGWESGINQQSKYVAFVVVMAWMRSLARLAGLNGRANWLGCFHNFKCLCYK